MALTWTYQTKAFRPTGESIQNHHQVRIIDRAGGISGTFCGTSAGATLSLNGNSRDVISPSIASATLSFDLVIEKPIHVAFIESLADFDERRFVVQYSRNGTLFFTGIILLEQVTTRFGNNVLREGASSPSGTFTVTAIDGITLLKGVDYRPEVLPAFTDRDTINNILGRCFEKLMTFGWGQSLMLRSNWEPSTGGGRDFWQHTKIDQEILVEQSRQGGYTYFSCFEIIQKVCTAFDLRCYPDRNNYVFEHINANVGGFEVGWYDLDGTPRGGPASFFSYVNVGCGETATWRLSPDVRTYAPPQGQIKVIYEFIFNGNFLAGNTWNTKIPASPVCYNNIGKVPVPNDTTRLRWAGDVQFIPREQSQQAQDGFYAVFFYWKIQIGSQYFVRELLDDSTHYFNKTFDAQVWTSTEGWYVERYDTNIEVPLVYDVALYHPFFITTLPIPQSLDGDDLSVCFMHEVYDQDDNLVQVGDFAIEHFIDNSDLIVLDKDNNIVEKTAIEKVVHNSRTNSKRHERTITFSTGPNKSSNNRLTDESTPPIDQLTYTGDQGTYGHNELLARTLMARTMLRQEFLEGRIKGGGSLTPGIGLRYDNKKWLPISYRYISGIENYEGEWLHLNLGDASGLASTEEEVFLETVVPRRFGGDSSAGGLTPVRGQYNGPLSSICVDSVTPPLPVPDTSNWTNDEIAARIEVYKQSVGSLFYNPTANKVDEWYWDNATRCIILGEPIRLGDKVTIRIWVG